MARQRSAGATRTILEGQVAQILNERELAINIGNLVGVREGMIFSVLAATPLEIHDPATGEVLGVEDREKVRVRAIRVHDRYAVCATYRVRHLPGGPLSGTLTAAAVMGDLLRQSQTVPETLRTASDSEPPPLDPADSYVKVGDRVIEIEELPVTTEYVPETRALQAR